MTKITRAPLTILLLLGLASAAGAQTYTIMPAPFREVFDNSGHIVVGGCVWTYAAGTTTPIATYSDNAGTANANPIVADFAGRFTAYLLAGTNYKFVYENVPCNASTHGSVLRTADNIAGVPGAAATVDIPTAVAGEAISAGQCVYWSDGSGGKTAGQVYKCDAANTYSSTTPEVGIAIAAIASTATGTIRLAGSVTGLSSLSVGAEYFIGTAGALTSTAPANKRHLGHADTATTLVLTGNPPPLATFNSPTINTTVVSDKLWAHICQGRLTLTTLTPVTTSDVTAATVLRFTPYAGSNLALYDGSASWTLMTFSEISIAIPATTSQLYDVFVFNNSGTATLELLAWTNDTTRATALVLQDGVLVKSGATTRRYVGLCRTTTVSGQTEDSLKKRFVWNYYNRVPRLLKTFDATDSWTYNTAAYRQQNNSPTNQVEYVIGVAEVELDLQFTAMSSNSAAPDNTFISIAEGSVASTTPDPNVIGQPLVSQASGTLLSPHSATLRKYPPIGYRIAIPLEQGSGANVTTWYGDNGASTKYQSGLLGRIAG